MQWVSIHPTKKSSASYIPIELTGVPPKARARGAANYLHPLSLRLAMIVLKAFNALVELSKEAAEETPERLSTRSDGVV